MNMTNKQSINSLFIAVLALCLFVAGFLGGRQVLPAFANERVYTNVLADLQKDETFSMINYPATDNPQDEIFGSIQVIQIAESESGELYLYTYQPSNKAKQLTATEINMSISQTVDGTSLFPLTLLNTNGVFCKYLVNAVIVSSDTTRYYNITSIYRDWDKDIDEETGNNNTKDSVAFPVGKLFKARTENGTISYACEYKETIEIINPYSDFLEYSNGFQFFPTWCHSHYVAFSTDKKIDTLMESTVSYVSRDASRAIGLGLDGKIKYSNEQKLYVDIKGTDKGENAADGWFSKKYEWKRIQTVDEFIKSEDLKGNTKTNLEGKQWVLRFAETEISVISGNGNTVTFWTDISQVSILRLKFLTDGNVYNLGAVSDIVSGDDEPGNNNTNEYASLWEWLARITCVPAWVWKLIAVLIPILILLPILSLIFPIVGTVLTVIFKALCKVLLWILKGIWWVISLPVRGIVMLVAKIKK